MSAGQGFAVRQCCGRDADFLSSFAREIYTAHYAGKWTLDGLVRFLDAEFDASRIRAELEELNVRYLIVDLGERAAGYAKLKSCLNGPIGGERVLEINKMYFAPWATGLGLGGRLMEHIALQATADGMAALWLQVLKINDSAMRAYQRYGFEPIEERPFWLDGSDVGMWIMRRHLAASELK